MQTVQSVSAPTDVEMVRHPKEPLILDKKHVYHRKKIVFSLLNCYRQDLLKQLYQFLCILLKKLFHWNRLDRRKYKECDLVSFLGRDAGPEDIYIWIRLSAQ